MRNNLFKAFLSAVAGSALLMVALFAMNIVRPEATVVEASPAVAAPLMATTSHVSMTIDPAVSTYGQKVSLNLIRNHNDDVASGKMTARVTITMKTNKWYTYTTWTAGQSTTMIALPLEVVSGTAKYSTKYPGKYMVETAVFSDNKYLEMAKGDYTVLPIIKFDSGVPAKVNLGQEFTATVKIQPEVMTNTEVIDYDFQNDGKVDASVKVISGTTSFVKPDKPDATYVYTMYKFTKGMTQTMKAIYRSGIYGEPMATVTQTIYVEKPTLTIKATPAEVKVGENVTLEGTTSFGLDSSEVQFMSAGWNGVTTPLSGTKATTTTKFATAGTYSITGKLMSKVYGDVVTSTVAVVKVNADDTCVADKIDAMVNGSKNVTIKAGTTANVTATVTCSGNPVKAGTVVSFTINADSSTVSAPTATTDDQGVVEVTVTGVSEGSAMVNAVLAENATVADKVAVTVYEGDEAPNVVPGATVEQDIAEDGSATATTTAPAGARQATFRVQIQAGTVVTLTDGTVVSLGGGKLVVTPLVSPTNEAALKTAANGDTTLFGVNIDVYYKDTTTGQFKKVKGGTFNPAIVVTVTLGNPPADMATSKDKIKVLYADGTSWKVDGITVTDVTATTITIAVSHLTQFGGVMQSGPVPVYLPFIQRVTSSSATTSTLTF